MWRWIVLALAGIAVVVVGFSLIESSGGDEVSASAAFAGVNTSIEGYARAIQPWDWRFPADFGAHPDFQTEWWYYTGNLADGSGRRFGFQFTVFRRAITPPAQTVQSDSEWRTGQVYLAHFTVSDIGGGAFHQAERFSRGGAGLAGATVDPRYRVWVENWQIAAQDDDAQHTTITADAGDFAISLNLEQIKPPALQGDNGLSPKSGEPGNASYYYSLSRLLTEGTITVGGQTYTVSGTSWKDHEFSTSALGGKAQGWDWFGLQLDDDRELMLGQIRLQDGGTEPAFGGLLINPDGTTRYLKHDDFTIDSTGTWTSPHTGATYPAGWDIIVNTGDDEPLHITLT
ncbi:MAG: carotenoid 1,2-hydratase, partial [Anaerolineae bacterium]|nr:carotenoid 1,2-hydratase [Anaerolineae bacterium]